MRRYSTVTRILPTPAYRIAGLGAAVVSFTPAALAVFIGLPFARSFDGTQLPLVTGFAVLGAIGLALVLWAETDRQESTRSTCQNS